MSAARVDLEGIQGDTFKRTLTFEQPPGTPKSDLGGYTLLAQVKLFNGDLSAPQAEFEILDGGATHKKILRLSSTIMSQLLARNYWWDFQWITPGGDTETKIQGFFTVTPQATVPV
jgi:hypothetical protein